MRDGALIPILCLLALCLIAIHLILMLRRIHYVKWEEIRRKRIVTRWEKRGLWLTVVSLVTLGLAIVFAIAKLDLLNR